MLMVVMVPIVLFIIPLIIAVVLLYFLQDKLDTRISNMGALVLSQRDHIDELERREKLIVKEIDRLSNAVGEKIGMSELQALTYSFRRRIDKTDKAIKYVDEQLVELERKFKNHGHSKEWVVIFDEVEESQ